MIIREKFLINIGTDRSVQNIVTLKKTKREKSEMIEEVRQGIKLGGKPIRKIKKQRKSQK
jgi:hypothetical protein